MCSFAVKEVRVTFCILIKNRVMAMLLDASKAFDRELHIKLVRLLTARRLRPLTYLRSGPWPHCTRIRCVEFKCAMKCQRPSCVSNWGKQGGVLSPVVFAVYG